MKDMITFYLWIERLNKHNEWQRLGDFSLFFCFLEKIEIF